jgi:hypothetical protein
VEPLVLKRFKRVGDNALHLPEEPEVRGFRRKRACARWDGRIARCSRARGARPRLRRGYGGQAGVGDPGYRSSEETEVAIAQPPCRIPIALLQQRRFDAPGGISEIGPKCGVTGLLAHPAGKINRRPQADVAMSIDGLQHRGRDGIDRRVKLKTKDAIQADVVSY